MRTKVLICAALVAAGAISAVAQNVYSLNIVGYVNVSAPAGYSMLANPLSTGTNGANEIITPVVDGSVFITFASGAYSYFGADSASPSGWVDATGATTQPPQLPPGKGFFYFNPGATAQNITFVGQVVPGPGVTNSMALPAGYSLVGSPMPVTGQLGTVLTTGIPPVPGAVNMPILDGMTLLPFASGAYSFQGYDSGAAPLPWIDQNAAQIPAPTITVGKGFFYFNPNAGAVQWQHALP
jgi:hypothetical protein